MYSLEQWNGHFAREYGSTCLAESSSWLQLPQVTVPG